MNLKRVISFLVSVVLLFALCSCGNVKYAGMKNYLNSNTNVKVISISDWVYNEEFKSVLLCIELPREADPSLEDLDGLRVALNDYMQQDGGFLEQGWQVSIYVDEQMNGSSIGERYAVFANFENGTMGFEGECNYDIADYLNTFWFVLDPDDAEYISSLNDVENLFIAGKYSESDVDLMNEVIEEIKTLDSLKTLRVFSYWYEGFAGAGLDCEIIECIGNDPDGTL